MCSMLGDKKSEIGIITWTILPILCVWEKSIRHITVHYCMGIKLTNIYRMSKTVKDKWWKIRWIFHLKKIQS